MINNLSISVKRILKYIIPLAIILLFIYVCMPVDNRGEETKLDANAVLTSRFFINDSTYIQQQFSPKYNNLRSINIRVGVFYSDLDEYANLKFEIIDESNRVIEEDIVRTDELINWQYHTININNKLNKDKRYTLRISQLDGLYGENGKDFWISYFVFLRDRQLDENDNKYQYFDGVKYTDIDGQFDVVYEYINPNYKLISAVIVLYFMGCIIVNIIKESKNKYGGEIVFISCLILILMVITWLIYNYRFYIDYYGLFTDDYTFNIYKEKSLLELIASSYSLRPLPMICRWILYKICGNDMLLWKVLQCALNIFSEIIIWFLIIRNVKNNNYLTRLIIASTCMLPIIISRFYWYQVTEEACGIMELCGTIFGVLTVWCLGRYIEREDWAFQKTIIFFCFALLSHERYLALVLPILFAIVIVENSNKIIHKCIIPIVIAIIYWGARIVLLDNAFVVQGSTKFSITRTILLFFKSIAILLGFNIGDTWILGVTIDDTPIWIIITCIVVVILLCVMIIKGLKCMGEDNRILIAYLLSILSLCATISVGTRIEYRWLYVPHIILIMMIGRIVGGIKECNRLFSIFILCVLTVDLFYSSYYKNYYLWRGSREKSEIYKIMEGDSFNDGYGIVIIQENKICSEEELLLCFEQVSVDDNVKKIDIDIVNSIEEIDAQKKYSHIIIEDKKTSNYYDIKSLLEGKL